LFRDVQQGHVTLYTPDTTIADAVFVLTSRRHYNLPRAQVAAMLTPLVKYPHFKVKNRRVVLRALSLFGATAGLDFGDAMIAAAMREQHISVVYS
jgi:predicted nucleic acid-binding protein